jgi:hypothetical protein
MTRRGPGRPPTGRPFEHAARVYRAMHARSMLLSEAPPKIRELADPATVTPESRIFVGGLMALFEEVGLRSRGQYHNVKNDLIAMGALARLRRGSGPVEAVWLLGPEPTVARWDAHVERPTGTIRRLAQVEREHHERLAWFLKHLPSIAPTTAEEMRLSGAKTVGEAINFLRGLPTARRVGLGPAACLRYCGEAEHTCELGRSVPDPVQPHPPVLAV